MRCEAVLDRLQSLADPDGLARMVRFGVEPKRTYGGIRVPSLRRLAREIGRDRMLAERLSLPGSELRPVSEALAAESGTAARFAAQ